jgi:eukaryotic-like serine/threonine-protein kinase
VEICVSVQPKTATIFIDGTKVSGNPYSGQFPLDGSTHSIRAEARGYGTKTWTIAYNENHELSGELPRKRSPATKRPARPSPRGNNDPWGGESASSGPVKEDPWGD